MKFKLFKTISENLINIFTSKENKFVSEENRYFDERFNEYLKVEDALFCYQMIEDGYEQTNEKMEILNEIVVKKLKNDEYKYLDLIDIKSLKPETRILALLKEMPDYNIGNMSILDKNKIFINEALVLDFLKNDNNKESIIKYIKDYTNFIKDYYQSGIDDTKDFYNKTEEQNYKVKKSIKNVIYVTCMLIKNESISQGTIQEIKESFQSVVDFMESKTKERYKSASFSKIGKPVIDSFLKEISGYQINILNTGNQKEDLLRRLKSREARKTPLAEEMKSLIINKEYSIDNLPKESKEKVDRITKLISSLNNQEVTGFVQERLPIIVKKYFSIDEDYRTSLKNVEGFNAQELMNQSLDNIEKIILAKKEDDNIELITEMSIENRKLKMRQI